MSTKATRVSFASSYGQASVKKVLFDITLTIDFPKRQSSCSHSVRSELQEMRILDWLWVTMVVPGNNVLQGADIEGMVEREG